MRENRVSPSKTAKDGSARALDRKFGWIVRLGVPLVRMLGKTWRIRCVNQACIAELRQQRVPIVFALWHGDMLPLLYVHRDEGVSVLISEHRDGELIARVAESLGFRTVRGSTSRGAARALVGIVRVLESGRDIAVTPDGPRGPAHAFAPGALIAAQRASVPVIAVGVAVRPAWRLKSWDRFVIPKPFARVTVAYSKPVRLDVPHARAAAQETSRFESLMGEMERLANA